MLFHNLSLQRNIQSQFQATRKKKSKKEKEKDKSRTKRHEEGLSKYLKRHLQLIDSSKVRFLLLFVQTK